MESFKNSEPSVVFAYLKNLVIDLDKVLGKHQYMLIGSYARDVYIAVKAGQESPRSTVDVDFSAVVVSEATFLATLEKIGRQSGGADSHHVTCRVVGGIDVDVLPFGKPFPDDVFRYKESEWDITGHREAFETAEIFVLDQTSQTSVKIPRLESLLGLKIIAWDMRSKDGVHKDAQDFHYLLGAGVELLQQEIWDDENQFALEACDYDSVAAAAYLIGYRLRETFAGRALSRCLGILAKDERQEEFYLVANRNSLGKKLGSVAHENYEAFLRGLRA